MLLWDLRYTEKDQARIIYDYWVHWKTKEAFRTEGKCAHFIKNNLCFIVLCEPPPPLSPLDMTSSVWKINEYEQVDTYNN